MELIPFENTWPYEKLGNDIYIEKCPYCSEDHVLTDLKVDDVEEMKDEVKKLLVMPCCHANMTIIQADDDYFWTTEPLRKRGDKR
ncbi:hypothetical protein SAMN05192534_10874 [Alteribacillus persepolensis]|uniref:Cysteine-rich CPXCG n=1 Tax=Alteribacillus persepolensis TaxID=568899 RepID=A0A1G8DY84_9BACI|nr:hypothetical protein [Alteribacillus persepolensis]SDH62682.1 hypothetical protein SAMN05192534_10874 [Alteribacillus persepolensis]